MLRSLFITAQIALALLLPKVILAQIKNQADTLLTHFAVIDAETLQPIPYVSIALLKANLAINTEKDGLFSIPGDLANMRDTVIINAQNYVKIVMPVNKLITSNAIKIRRAAFKKNKLKRKLSRDTLLNNFKRRDITHYAGIQKPNATEDQFQIAQQFDVPVAGTVLQSVMIHRLAFTFHSGGGTESTRFRLRIYGLDKDTGGPGKDLCESVVEVKNKELKRMRVNLKDHNIVIPDTTFFVAIETLRNYDNFGYAEFFSREERKLKKFINYRPAIAISPVRTQKQNIWIMDIRGNWKRYTYFSPDFTDLAITATIKR